MSSIINGMTFGIPDGFRAEQDGYAVRNNGGGEYDIYHPEGWIVFYAGSLVERVHPVYAAWDRTQEGRISREANEAFDLHKWGGCNDCCPACGHCEYCGD